MQRKVRAATASAVAAVFFPAILLSWPDGPPIRRTGAPGDKTCLDTQCHVGERIADSASVQLDLPEGLTYRPGMKQRWRLRLVDPDGIQTNGYQLTTRLVSNLGRSRGGSLSPVDGRSYLVCDDGDVRTGWYCGPAVQTEFAFHKMASTENTWEFDWVPPGTADAGPVHVYVAANSGGRVNARIHLRSFVLTPSTAEAPDRPVIAAVRNAVSGGPEVAPGTWVSIYGQNLAPDAQVLAGNQAATVSYASPGQVNALMAAAGPVELETRAGRSLPAVIAELALFAPAVFTRADGLVVTEPELPARGTAVAFWLTGVASAAPSLVVEIGGMRARVVYSGALVPGVWQINVEVPAGLSGEGNYPVVVTVGGLRSLTSPLIRVR